MRRLLVALWFCCLLPLAVAASPTGWELYLSPDWSFGLYTPPGWQVRALGATVSVTDPGTGSTAVLTQCQASEAGPDSLVYATRTLENVRRANPKLQLAWARSTADRRRTVVETRYPDDRGREMRGRCYFFRDGPVARFWGYEAPVADFPRLQATLISILANYTPLNQDGLQKLAGRRIEGPLPMAPQSLPDGTGSMQVPQGWVLRGGQGQALCLSGDGRCGFSFGTTNFWDRSRIPRFDNSRLPGLHHAYTRPMDAVALVMQQAGSSAIQAAGRWSNPERAQQAQAATNRGAESETAVLHYVAPNGVATEGYFDALTFSPNLAGQWLVLYWGVWAPQTDFARMLNTLVPMASSYKVNERWAADYIQQGLARLRQLQAQTRAAVTDAANYARETNLAIFQEKMRSGDYLDYKRTATIRGEQEWVSEVEGGALYKSDHWGLSREGQTVSDSQEANYYNFQGENPAYRESMTPVDSSRDVYERVFRSR